MHQKPPWYHHLTHINPLAALLAAIVGIPAAILAYQTLQNKTFLIYSKLADVPNVPSMTVRYGGSTSFAPLRGENDMSKRIQQVHTGFKLTYIEPLDGKPPGSNTGIRMLLDNSLHFAEASRPLDKEEYEEAKGKNFSLEQKQVAYDGVVFYVNLSLHANSNPNTPLSGLTISNLKKILTGEITNWKDVGGPDRPITVISRDPKFGGTPKFIRDTVMEKKDFAESTTFEENTTRSINLVKKTLGGISYATASEVCNQQKSVRSVPLVRDENQPYISPCINDKNTNYVNLSVIDNATYPVTRPMFVIIRRDGGLSEKAGIAYVNMLLSSEGQQIMKRAGLAPIHNER